MKHTTKRSKVEEVVIDFEDGCVLKLTKYNIHSVDTQNITCLREGSSWYMTINMVNGISATFTTMDEKLIEDLHELFR